MSAGMGRNACRNHRRGDGEVKNSRHLEEANRRDSEPHSQRGVFQ